MGPWCAKAVQQSDKGLGAEHVFHLKRFQYIRRLRRGVRCILAVLRLIEALQQRKKYKVIQNKSACLSSTYHLLYLYCCCLLFLFVCFHFMFFILFCIFFVEFVLVVDRS